MFPKVTEFIKAYKHKINDNDFEYVFSRAAEELVTHEISQLATMLESIGIETESIRWNVFEQQVKGYVDYWLYQTPSYMKNKSESWSRLDYMIEDISNLGFGEPDAKAYVIKNGKRLGLNLLALEPQYGWYGSGDYDLGWFNKREFEKEYPDD